MVCPNGKRFFFSETQYSFHRALLPLLQKLLRVPFLELAVYLRLFFYSPPFCGLLSG